MKKSRLLLLVPAVSMFLVGCSKSDVIKKAKDILRPVKSWVGEKIYWPARDIILGEGYSVEDKTSKQNVERVELKTLEEKKQVMNEVLEASKKTAALKNYTLEVSYDGVIKYLYKYTETRSYSESLSSATNSLEPNTFSEIYEETEYVYGYNDGSWSFYYSKPTNASNEGTSVGGETDDETLEKIKIYKEGNKYIVESTTKEDLITTYSERYPSYASEIEAYFSSIEKIPSSEIVIENGVIVYLSTAGVSIDIFNEGQEDEEFSIKIIVVSQKYSKIGSTEIARPECVVVPYDGVIPEQKPEEPKEEPTPSSEEE